MRTLFFIFVFIIIPLSLYSTIINVSAGQSIQDGINAAANTDTVLVQPGTYVENINYNGKLITVGSLFITTADTSYISSTIIDGNNNDSVVIFNNGEDSTSVLCGFTITNGLTNCGGGILCFESSPCIENVTITSNSADHGGGIYFFYSSTSLQNIIITANSASNGGGIYCDSSSPNLQNVTITGNSTSFGGGGIYCIWYSSPNLQNVTISCNTASFNGGGISSYFSNLILINSILWNNSLQQIYIDSGSLTATYSDIQGSWAGTGNIDSDPLFVDPGNGDYHLQSISPCIDTGDPASQLDPDGTRADMGTYFFHQLIPPIANFTTDTTQGYSPLTINFTDLSMQGSVAITEWLWDFGDGNNSSLQNPANEYQLPGIYTVSLTVTDENDSTDTTIKTNYITVEYVPPAPPTNVQVDIVHPDAIITWTAVDTTIFGDPINVDAYLVYYCGSADSVYYFHGLTTDTTYTHQYVAQFSNHMFYQVTSYVGGLRFLQSVITENPDLKLGELDLLIEEKRLRKNKDF